MSSLRLQQIIFAQIIVGLLASFAPNPSYNVPILLFGLLAVNNMETSQPLKIFAILTTLTLVTDVVWLSINNSPDVNRTSLSSFKYSLAMTIINLLSKPVTVMLIFRQLKVRGDTQFNTLVQNGGSNQVAYDELESPESFIATGSNGNKETANLPYSQV
ncbi:hypothetical protein MIR68_006768 [Amoeboaphelidium protococcarum]|nr:hypothetical protein MIR68_009687 [Amoeboaphelidium protococcarum]KAI3635202.1 hypothetical protein MIR68_006768 [Amoeboaphelidium protococcarum]KAI3646356.1 hypothetical protein MP228_009284 [Amoeboaphelidium protococcarum]